MLNTPIAVPIRSLRPCSPSYLCWSVYPPANISRSHLFVRWNIYVWLAQNIILTFFAVWRLVLYIETYGMTRWRLSATIWLITHRKRAGTIILRIASNRNNRWLINANSALVASVLSAPLCSISMDLSLTGTFNIAPNCYAPTNTHPLPLISNI